jgi:hypothetical protein
LSLSPSLPLLAFIAELNSSTECCFPCKTRRWDACFCHDRSIG